MIVCDMNMVAIGQDLVRQNYEGQGKNQSVPE